MSVSENLYSLNLQTSSLGDDGNSFDSNPVLPAISCLFEIALLRLKVGGRLVFWLPTESFIKAEDVRIRLECIEQEVYTSHQSGSESKSNSILKFERMSRQELHDVMWRWLIVYVKEDVIK